MIEAPMQFASRLPATATAARDAKAFVQGVVEGVKQQRTININHSSVNDLKSLPGIDDVVANASSSSGHIATHTAW
jgi:DNA uptake protein ComE-like DNA-binding protein